MNRSTRQALRSNGLFASQIVEQCNEALRRDEYGLGRTVRSLLEGQRSLAPVEHEVSAMITRETGQQTRTGNSILVPTRELVRHDEQRDLTVALGSGGGYVVATDQGPVV